MKQSIIFAYVVLICAGISLFSFLIVGSFTLSITDVVIGILILYGLFVNRMIYRGTVFYVILFFAIVCLLSGVVNASLDSTFFVENFILNYIRIIGLVLMVLLFPPLQSKIGNNRIALATLWILRVHAVLIIADAFLPNPIDWTHSGIGWSERTVDLSRPRGLFVEPAYFGIYAGLSLLYILQVERNTGVRILGSLDIILFSLSLIVSAAVSSIGLLLLFLYEITQRKGNTQRVKLLIVLLLIFLSVTVLARQFQKNTSIRSNLEYIVKKVGNLRYGLEDERIRVRGLGSVLFSLEVINSSPLLGVGLGGKNQNRILYKLHQPVNTGAASEEYTYSTNITFSSVIIGSGLIGLLLYSYILLWMLKSNETRIIGKCLLIISFMWGNAFAPIVWWYVCLSLSLRKR